jgi:hypothetical protein
MRFLIPLAFVTLLAQAQAPPPAVPAQWEIGQTLEQFTSQARRLRPILDQLKPEAWVSKGAPQAYVAQWNGAKDELGYLVNTAKALKQDPEKLTIALDAYFRMQSLETQVRSLADGVRKYQNPAIGDLMVGVMGDNSVNRDKLRQYITDLAANKEQESEVLQEEAQRCRGVVNRQGAPQSRKKSSQSNE